MESFTLVFFKGTPVQIPASPEKLKKNADDWLKAGFKDGRCLKEMGDDCLQIITGLEQRLVDTLGLDSFNTTRDYAKAWGDDYATSLAMWIICVCVLIKLKYIKDDNENGFQIIEMSKEHKNALVKAGICKKQRILNTCCVCAKKGAFKKCSKCKRDHYCGEECQKADWSRHKAKHH